MLFQAGSKLALWWLEQIDKPWRFGEEHLQQWVSTVDESAALAFHRENQSLELIIWVNNLKFN